MRPTPWQPPVPLSPPEAGIVARISRARFFIFLRRHRHATFDVAFQEELGTMFAESTLGQPPVPPARLALATILQAYTRVSDDEIIEATLMDRRWQLALDCLDCTYAPFSKGTLVAFRERLLATDPGRRLIERTVEVATATKGFGARALLGALDSSPLWGAGRVEDTLNLLGHALRKAVGLLARQRGRGLAAMTQEAGAPLLGASSLKAALDCDWDDPLARDWALGQVLGALEAVSAYVGEQVPSPALPAAQASVAVARPVCAQDVTERPDGAPTLRQGVAAERRISVEDGQMRHGRKNRAERVDGYKRHALTELDSQLVRAVGVTASDAPEASVTEAVLADLAHQGARLRECHIDRAYLSSALVRDRPPDLAIYCKAWPVAAGPHFPKTAFALDWEHRRIRCPSGTEAPFAPGGTVHFPAQTCAAACSGRPAPAARAGGASPSMRMKPCWPSCASADRRPPGGPSCVSASPSSIAWHISATGKGTAPAIAVCARTSLTCAAPPSSRTCTSSPASPVSRPPPVLSSIDYLTDVLEVRNLTATYTKRISFQRIHRPATYTVLAGVECTGQSAEERGERKQDEPR